MRYCPKCNTEYRDGVTVCADDFTALVEKEQFEAGRAAPEKGTNRLARLTSLLSLDDQFEAEELADALAEEGFDVALVSNKSGPFGTAAMPGPDMYSIVVPESDAARAGALLTEWRAGLEAGQGTAEAAAESEEAASEKSA